MVEKDRLSDEKRVELSQQALDALLNGTLDDQQETLDEFDRINKEPTKTANELLGLNKTEQKPSDDDDRYIPETNSMFSDAKVPDNIEIEDEEPKKIKDPLSDVVHDEPSDAVPASKDTDPSDIKEDSVSKDKEPNLKSADEDKGPATSTLDFDDEEDEDDDLNVFQKLLYWVNEDDSGLRKWIVIGGGVVFLLIIALIGVAITGRASQEEPVAQAPATATQEQTQQEAAPQAEIAGSIAPVGAVAQCPKEGSTDASSAFDNDKTTAWVCQRVYGVDGVVLDIDLAAASTIKEISVVPGFNYTAPRGEDEWNKHRVVTKIEWQFGDNYDPVIQEITPSRGESSVKIPEVTTNHVTARILATEPADLNAPQPQPGSPDDTFAISSISIIGTGGKTTNVG